MEYKQPERLQINEVAKSKNRSTDLSEKTLTDAIAYLQKYQDYYAKKVYYTNHYTQYTTTTGTLFD